MYSTSKCMYNTLCKHMNKSIDMISKLSDYHLKKYNSFDKFGKNEYHFLKYDITYTLHEKIIYEIPTIEQLDDVNYNKFHQYLNDVILFKYTKIDEYSNNEEIIQSYKKLLLDRLKMNNFQRSIFENYKDFDNFDFNMLRLYSTNETYNQLVDYNSNYLVNIENNDDIEITKKQSNINDMYNIIQYSAVTCIPIYYIQQLKLKK